MPGVDVPTTIAPAAAGATPDKPRFLRSLPLSPTQQAMLYHNVASPGSGAYVQHAICDLDEQVDADLLLRAWRDAVACHAILRTAFRLRGTGGPRQEVVDQIDVDLAREDWRALAADAQAARLDARIDADRAREFAPECAPLMRLALIRLADARYRLVWTYHHALLDGRAVRVVLREVLDAYDARRSGRAPDIAPAAAFDEHVAWLAAQDRAAAERYWKDALAGFTAPTSLASPHAVRTDVPAGYAAHELKLAHGETEALAAFARGRGVTLNTLVIGAWAQLLHRYSGDADVGFGVTVSLRGAGPPAFRDMVGPLINTVPMRVRVPADATLGDWLADLRSQWLALRPHAFASPAQIRQWCGIARDVPLLDSLVVFERAPLDETLAADRPDWTTTRRFARRAGAGHPLTLVAFGEPELLLKLVHDRAQFDAWMMAPMLDHLRTLLVGMPAAAAKPLREQALLSTAETRRILVDWNDTARTFADEAPVHALIARQARHAPDALAVLGGARTMTYGALDAASSRLAQRLAALGAKPGTFVALLVDRSPDLIVAMLGILRAGAAYVPLDPAYPDERVASIVADAAPAVIVTTSALAPRLATHACAHLLVDSDDDGATAHAHAVPRDVNVAPDDPAYAVFTSGSTGKPKGIVVSHRSLANHTLDLANHYDLSPADRRLQFVSLGSDVLIADVFPVLIRGGSVVLRPDEGLPTVAAFLRFLDEHRITLAALPSGYWHEWVGAMARGEAHFPAALRFTTSGMDAARPDLLAIWRENAPPHVRWFNAYGPSEATCTTTRYEAGPAAREITASVPIGRPISNMRVYIVDTSMRPVPVGVPGELLIGGVGVAQGYLNQPGLTAERFIADPFDAQRNGRLYRTGDMARFLPDGNVEFLGRGDEQIKIRGYRVEPREVEAALEQLPGVRDVAVVALGDPPDHRRLVAYVVAGWTGKPPPAAELRAQLRTSLPDYMLPADFVPMSAIPRTPEGKLDRRALPAPAARARPPGRALVGAGDPLEYVLVELWQDLLKTLVGVRDDFFDLGGDSLLAVQMMDEVGRIVGCEVPLTTLFAEATISRLAVALKAKAAPDGPPIAAVNTGGARMPLLYLHGDYTGGGFYCRPLAQALGADQPFYAIHPHGIDRAEIPPTIEAMAAERVATLGALLPRGPYVLAGHCAGGYVALEMARQLKAAGEEVPVVVIIDAKAPLPPLRGGMPVSSSVAAQSLLPAGPARVARNIITARYVPVIASYAPGPYAGRIAVLKSARMHDSRPHLGWGAIARDVDSTIIPGDHFAAITRHAPELAAALRRCIDEALSSQTAPASR
jgi:amino acid adenylation domain-containing protein